MLEKKSAVSSAREELEAMKLRLETLSSQLQQHQNEVNSLRLSDWPSLILNAFKNPPSFIYGPVSAVRNWRWRLTARICRGRWTESEMFGRRSFIRRMRSC